MKIKNFSKQHFRVPSAEKGLISFYNPLEKNIASPRALFNERFEVLARITKAIISSLFLVFGESYFIPILATIQVSLILNAKTLVRRH